MYFPLSRKQMKLNIPPILLMSFRFVLTIQAMFLRQKSQLLYPTRKGFKLTWRMLSQKAVPIWLPAER